MDEYIDQEAYAKVSKIKTNFAQIIVGGNAEKPCYNILYFDQTNKQYHIGFGSFSLEKVFKWLEEEFEIIDDTAADVVEVVRCKDCKHYRKKEESLVYDEDTCDILFYCDGTHRTACEQDFCSYGERKDGAECLVKQDHH